MSTAPTGQIPLLTAQQTVPSAQQSQLPMTPEQAAQKAGVSRRTIVRAIERQQLLAFRDNRNRWRITQEAIDQWAPPNAQPLPSPVGTPEDSPPAPSAIPHEIRPPQVDPEETTIRITLAAETARADAAERARDQAEADRDRWQRMAETLAQRPRFRWPWNR